MVLNLGSLIMGIMALLLPIINIAQHNKASQNRSAVYIAISVSACSLSLCLQLFEFNRRVNVQDWSALMDTSRAVAIVASMLLAGTIMLNVIALAVKNRRQPDN